MKLLLAWKDYNYWLLVCRQTQNYSLSRTLFALHTTAIRRSHQCSGITILTTLNMPASVDCSSFPGRLWSTHAIGWVKLLWDYSCILWHIHAS